MPNFDEIADQIEDRATETEENLYDLASADTRERRVYAKASRKGLRGWLYAMSPTAVATGSTFGHRSL